MFPGLRESMERRLRLDWEAKGIGFGGKAIAIAKHFGGTLEAADRLQVALLNAFDSGVSWEYRRHEKLKWEKVAKERRKLARKAKP